MTEMTVDLGAHHRHYLDHLLPVWRALPADVRGTAYLGAPIFGCLPDARPFTELPDDGTPILLAGFEDVKRCGSRPVILMEHGVGQSYAGTTELAQHPAYAGGAGRHGIVAMLCPNEYAAARNREASPDVMVEVIGSPRLAALQSIPAPPEPGERPVVAVAFHWDCTISPETAATWRHWADAVKSLVDGGRYEVLGHAHPRMFRDLAPTYRQWGIEPVEDFQQVLARAHVLACDNSSVLFEFAQLRGPVVVLDAPQYRRHVEHGLRFWDAADVGPRIREPLALEAAIHSALTKRPWPGAEERLDRVFPPMDAPARVAARAVVKALKLGAPVKSRGGARFPRVAGV